MKSQPSYLWSVAGLQQKGDTDDHLSVLFSNQTPSDNSVEQVETHPFLYNTFKCLFFFLL